MTKQCNLGYQTSATQHVWNKSKLDQTPVRWKRGKANRKRDLGHYSLMRGVASFFGKMALQTFVGLPCKQVCLSQHLPHEIESNRGCYSTEMYLWNLRCMVGWMLWSTWALSTETCHSKTFIRNRKLHSFSSFQRHPSILHAPKLEIAVVGCNSSKFAKRNAPT